MEESKYYTPELEEFYCLGFEYQSKVGFQDGTVKTKEQFDSAKWTDNVVSNEYDFPYINRALNGKNAKNRLCGIRVKYLDREDIESLGWIALDSVFTIPYKDPRQVCNEMSLIYAPLTNWVLITQYDNRSSSTENNITRFSGIVKNKSELKRLMKMLQINL